LALVNSSNLLLNPPNREHIALLYENKQELHTAISQYINEGLARGQFCVFATVHYRDEGYIQDLSSSIVNFKDNLENGSLLMIDLAPLYIAALLNDIEPFEKARKLLMEKAKDRKDRHVRFVGDGTGFLFKNKHFDACAVVEQWWQEKPFEGSYVCPYPKQFFDGFPHDIYSERAVVVTHDIVLDVSDSNSVKDEQSSILQEQLSLSEKIQASNIQGTTPDDEGVSN